MKNEKDLFLILKKQYFDQIKDGTKTSEFREVTPYWITRLTNKTFKYVTFQLGYQKDAQRIRKEILDIEEIVLQHEFFGNDPIDAFEIKLI